MQDKGLVSIDQKFLGQGDLFGIKFSNGYAFFEVVGKQVVQYKPHTATGEVAAGESTTWRRLEEDSDDILHIENQDNKILHGAIGISPTEIRMYNNYPESENRMGKLPNLSTPTPGDKYGYIDGRSSPYNEPTDAREFWIPPNVHLDFAFTNPDSSGHSPILNLKFASYNVKALDPNTHRDSIKRIVTPGSPMPVSPAGTPDYQTEFRGSKTFGNVLVREQEIESLRG